MWLIKWSLGNNGSSDDDRGIERWPPQKGTRATNHKPTSHPRTGPAITASAAAEPQQLLTSSQTVTWLSPNPKAAEAAPTETPGLAFRVL